MAKLSPEAKKRLSSVLNVARVTFQYGFIPVVIYLGFKRGADEGMPPLALERNSGITACEVTKVVIIAARAV